MLVQQFERRCVPAVGRLLGTGLWALDGCRRSVITTAVTTRVRATRLILGFLGLRRFPRPLVWMRLLLLGGSCERSACFDQLALKLLAWILEGETLASNLVDWWIVQIW